MNRIEKERKEFNKWKKAISCSGDPREGDKVWNIVMDGPKDSPYAGGKFKIRITFGDNYPSEVPKFEFLTVICHINIDTDEDETKNEHKICLTSINNYRSEYHITDILGQIFVMLNSPNESNAFEKYRDLYKNDYNKYLSIAREMTKKYAK